MARRPRHNSGRVDNDKLGFELTKIGASRFDLSDPYHLALTVRWPAFLAALVCAYGLITTSFGLLYLLRPDSITGAHGGSLADRMFFSIETLATVGYGEMYPATVYGHLVASAEIVTGMAFTAIMTGLIFVRFSRPRSKFVFSDWVVITTHNTKPTLMVRIGNGRTSLLTRTVVQVNALINEASPEGGRYRRVHELALTRASFPIFPLISTFMHVIDDSSPLVGFDLTGLSQTDMRLLVSIEAHDPALGANVQDLRTYKGPDLRAGWRFIDAVTVLADGGVIADLTRISLIEQDDPGPMMTGASRGSGA